MRTIKRRTALAALGAAASTLFAGTALAQQTMTLRLHQMLPPQATIPAKAIVPWAQKVEAESGGRIKIQLFHAMQLGGAPPQLFDQARDGVVDITWTVLGYTPGRFNKSEVFELPFMSGSAEQSSRAFQAYVEKFAADEFKDVKLIAVHTHGPGLFHTKAPVTGLESLRGMKIRGGSRIINNMLTKLGANPVGMPVPAVTEALSKGVIDGTTIPWEVTPALKVSELVKNHTTFAGQQGLYTQTFAFSMNRSAYDKLPADLKKVIDNNSGIETAAMFGRAMDEGDKVGRAIAEKAGNNIVALDVAETQRWRRTAGTVETDWVNEMKGKNIDGAKLASEARALIAKYSK
ncbi:MAG TPA: C4-dicarboxylate ABC transporter [Hydrogenophaga sp.]|jgi:TRAP-type C4-dicarboxylate transport system substrate-binding protein|uniref:TRAP transporter substrate-binding protein n=1 Tax=Hydrogenophaga sp. TaxID=1904254 RepID=UPI0008BCD803|nr:TRAP transporter substrate-binding protein [Hydrogenophaga sp.]MBU4180943.1 TRAP transporter substrate-binding protein [Gammaproteobacteria bacterium]OGA77811.1 MAG: C4-dicarboxylate ABC transporter [Burkholderiales bacterium GWE1_65_30]OGA94162.1 MAG: C4-dicarboxylate ABC transporter [Burkholderiales bacterium GWF1_66_17]OGB33252.1 MAG: C4-dicarboxylate ABC transporter [Burkholderiales bacterium RIFCSPLOWO2_02_FULL_66_35]MBU4282915.1 TRAP transporter substrate-binding protein [Gammaproteob